MDPANYNMRKQEAETWIYAFPEILKDMTKTMEIFTSILCNRSMACRQFSKIQRECKILLDSILKLPELSGLLEKLKIATRRCVEDIFKLMETEYEQYLDKKAALPIVILEKACVEVRTNMDILSTLFKKGNIDPELQKAIFFCMNEILRLKKISYGQMKYVKYLQKLLITSIKQHTDVTDIDVCKMLYRGEYNYKGFISYYKVLIRQIVLDGGEKPDYRTAMYFEQEFRHPIFHKNNMRYDEDVRKCYLDMQEFMHHELN